jgi:hypothetical protein
VRIIGHSITSFLAQTMKELVIVQDFKAKIMTVDKVILPMRNSTICKARMLPNV